jgi:ADP-ribosylglycohydrolase
MIGGGVGGWEPGEWTDDTQMAICIAEEAATGTLEPTAVASRFLSWYRSNPADVGTQTRAVLARADGPTDLAPLAVRYFELHPNAAAGNGSLMRTAPVALAALGDDDALVELATSISALTHADPLAGEACVLWCVAIDRTIRDGTFDGVRAGLEALRPDRRRYWAERFEEAAAGPPSRFNPNGFVVSALQAALSSIWHTPVPQNDACRHLVDALHTAVRVGDDTDTVAAIAGSLLGARWGASAIPVEWRRLLHGWPRYTAEDLVRLAMLSVRRTGGSSG